jgi:TRAP-type C4-dicarboxylate transport system permease small subunit
MFAIGFALFMIVFVIECFVEESDDDEDEPQHTMFILGGVSIIGICLMSFSVFQITWQHLP